MMSYLEEVLSDFRKGAKIRRKGWSKNAYIFMENTLAKDSNSYAFNFNLTHLFCDDWEFYQEPEPDWDYIIKNKCPCWFWDDNFQDRALGLLDSIDQANIKFPYGRDHNDWWHHCCPVHRDEVNFYVDGKDEN